MALIAFAATVQTARSLRVEFTLTADMRGLSWVGGRDTGSGPREGSWPRDAIEGVRLVKGKHYMGPPWRDYMLEVKVHGTWRELAWGHREGLVWELAEALGRSLRIHPEVVDVDPEGTGRVATKGPLPNVMRASKVSFMMFWGLGAVGAVLIASTGAVLAGVFMGLLVGGVGSALELQGAYRLRAALGRFAEEMPVAYEPFETVQGVQGLLWPGLGMEVRGQVMKARVEGLYVQVPGETYLFPPRRARVGGREIAQLLRSRTQSKT